MTYTAPTVTKLQLICEASELPMNVRTSDRRNSRLTSELPTLSIFENHCNRVRIFEVSELPIHVRTPDRQNFRLTSKLPTLSTFKNCCWPLVIHTGHVRYDHHRELSKLFKLRVVGTPDHYRSFRPSELPTNQPENNNFIVTGQIPDTSGIARSATNQLALLSLKHSNLTWGMA